MHCQGKFTVMDKSNRVGVCIVRSLQDVRQCGIGVFQVGNIKGGCFGDGGILKWFANYHVSMI